MLHWLIHTPQGLVARVGAGAAILLVLAALDLQRNGRRATRWREYGFLLFCVAAAMTYGVVNDQVTSAISWEYFYYGKELDRVLGPAVPPDRVAMRWQAARIGAMATWSVGLLLGAALLIANNPRKHGPPPLATMRLIALLPGVLLITMAFAAAFGALGWYGRLNWASADFREMWATNLFRPRHFTAAWGAHLGGYIGGLLAGSWAVWRVVRERRTDRLTSFG